MEKIFLALDLAAKAHEGQLRKLGDIPYITHPVGVGMLLLDSRCSEDVIISGILHDVIEDTDLTYMDIKQQFGQQVADIVYACSEPDKTLSWEERKAHTIEDLKNASLMVKLVVCADKLHNTLNILKEKKTKQDRFTWEGFKRGEEQQAWYYTNVYQSLIYGLSESELNNPLFTRLRDVLEELFPSG